jgi:hypothetical protein
MGALRHGQPQALPSSPRQQSVTPSRYEQHVLPSWDGLQHVLPLWSDIHMRGASAHARAMVAWLGEPPPTIGLDWQRGEVRRFLDGFAALVNAATVDDCIYAGFEFDRTRRPLLGYTYEHHYAFEVAYSPAGAHLISSAAHNHWRGALYWVGDRMLGVPLDTNGWPLADPRTANWCGEHHFFVEIGGLADHPDFDRGDDTPLGNVRGLLIWDAQRQRQRIELPTSTELWTRPRIAVVGDMVEIYAAYDDIGRRPPARVVTW